MPVNYENIGARVKYYRTRRKMTQEKLAELSLISKPQISAIERGDRAPSLDTIINIANALEISMDNLLADSVAVSSGTTSEDFSLLLDCSPAESDILIESMKGLKHILKKHDIK